MTKLAIFDLDGTLLNTIDDLGLATNYALRQCGFPEREMKEYNMLVGKGIYNLFRGALPKEDATEENVGKMASFFIPYYDKHLCDNTMPYEGIDEMLSEVTSKGIGIAIASNKYQEGAERIVSHYFGRLKFVRILGQRKGSPIKPDPQIVTEIMTSFGKADLDEVVYAGDSDVDMETGNNAGVRTIGALWGFRTREEIQKHSPWRMAENPQELCKYIIG